MLEQFEVDIQIMPGPSKKRKAAKSLKSLRGVSERLHGIVQLPEGFDYKSELGDALLKKYTSHG
jgi:DNA mismatch repair protein MutH